MKDATYAEEFCSLFQLTVFIFSACNFTVFFLRSHLCCFQPRQAAVFNEIICNMLYSVSQ